MTIGEIIKHFDLFNDRVGIGILPNDRYKYMKGDEMYFASVNYKDCVIRYLTGRNDAVVFIVTRPEAIKNGIIKE